jgi:hypothetical protein
MKPTGKHLLFGTLVAAEIAAAVFAWRDLARRSGDQVRGKKNMWRVFMVLNPGNSLIYWVFGRRGAAAGV